MKNFARQFAFMFCSLGRLVRVTLLWVILLPLGLGFTGAASNQIVMIANHGKFPVMLNRTMAGKSDIDQFGLLDDQHCVMSADTHLNLMGDIFNFGRQGIESIGDLLIDLGGYIWQFCLYGWLVLVVRKLKNA